jgi:hypothetical protein
MTVLLPVKGCTKDGSLQQEQQQQQGQHHHVNSWLEGMLQLASAAAASLGFC